MMQTEIFLRWMAIFLSCLGTFVATGGGGNSCKWIGHMLACSGISQTYLKTYDCHTVYPTYPLYSTMSVNNSTLPIIDSDSFIDCSYDVIYIVRSKIRNVTRHAFQNHTYLRLLFLQNNFIEDLYFCSNLTLLRGLNVSFNKIKELPAIMYLRKLNFFYASNNLIEQLTPSTFKYLGELSELNLASNKISNLPDNVFSGMKNLQELKLQQNPIKTLQPFALIGINNLVSLDLSYCQLVNISGINSIKNITKLDLSNNRLHDISFLQALKSLRSLDVSKNDNILESMAALNLSDLQWLRMSIRGRSIDNKTFYALPALKGLAIEDSDILSMQNYPFEKMPQLKSIFLRNTTVRRLCFKSFFNLPFVSSTEHIVIANDNYIALNFSNLKIEEIVIDKLGVLNDKTFNLDFSHNRIARIATDSLNDISNIDILRIDYNKIQIIDENAFNNILFRPCLYTHEMLIPNPVFKCNNELYLNDNLLKKIKTNTFTNLKNVFSIDLTDNVIEEIEPRAFDGLYMHIYNSSFTRSQPNEINLTNNKLSKLFKHTFAGIINLKALILRRNKIFFIEAKTFDTLTSLTTLDLSCNKLNVLDQTIFARLSALSVLDLSSNRLSNLELGIFKFLSELSSLNLASNQLSGFSTGVLSPLTVLRNLNISNNLFSDLKPSVFYYLRYLEKIDLSDNLLESFDYDSLRSHLVLLEVVSVHGNRFKCTFLNSMLIFFKKKYIRYNLNDRVLEYDRENIDGILCYEEDIQSSLYNNNSITAKPKIYNHTSDITRESDILRRFSQSALLKLAYSNLIFSIITLSILCVVVYNVIVHKRRQNCDTARENLLLSQME